MYKVNPHTHQECRSLLQKAVRRGDSPLVAKVVDHLYEIGDAIWLKRRVGVIIAEECWPLMAEWELPKNPKEQQSAIKDILTQAALSVKFKDAAGLGSLAHAFSEGDNSVLTGSDDYPIKLITAAIKKEKKYWKWVVSQCTTPPVTRLVRHAEAAYRKGGWPWDKAFIQATAYLAITHEMPDLSATSSFKADFPFWVALDKHTPQGKAALRKLAKKTGIPWRQLNWISFYCESGRVDNAYPSRWWDRAAEWHLNKVGLSFEAATSIWNQVKPVFVELLRDESQLLQEHIGDYLSYNLLDTGQIDLLPPLERAP